MRADKTRIFSVLTCTLFFAFSKSEWETCQSKNFEYFEYLSEYFKFIILISTPIL